MGDSESHQLPPESASPPRRRARSTSAERGRHSTTGSGPPRAGRGAGAADRGHRPRALDPENVEQILDALRWLELDWDEGPVSQSERAERHRERLAGAARRRRAYRDTATATTSRPGRSARQERGYRGEPSDDPARCGPAAGPRRGARPSSTTRSAARSASRTSRRRLRDRPRRRVRALQLRRRRRRRRHGDHRRDPRRRPPLQHAEAAAGDGGARGGPRRATPTCRCCTGPTARSSPSATAPPASRSCATRATCRPRCATTWPCSGGAPTTTRRS